MKKYAIGVDIGGGSVKLGVVDSSGRVWERETFLTDIASGRGRFLDILTAHITDLKKSAAARGRRVCGVGIGAPGPIDVERGFVYFFPNIPGWKNTPLKPLLEKRLKLPVRVDNDANAMALAEARFGPAGKKGQAGDCVIALTLGTGVGGGIVFDGKLYHGHAFSAAEIGHMTIDSQGPRCGCGQRGCLETFVGTEYFKAEMKRRAGKAIAPRDAAALARKKPGSRQARIVRDVFARSAYRLATALASLANILNPRRIVIGGGIAQNKDFLFEPLRREFSRRAFMIAARSVRIEPARLGTDAGLIGAAALVWP